MPSIPFRDLVELTAGAIADCPISYEMSPETLAELLTQENLNPLPSKGLFPSLTLDEIAIDIPVHFQVLPSQTTTLVTSRLMTTLPSPLVPQSTMGLSHFKVTLTIHPNS